MKYLEKMSYQQRVETAKNQGLTVVKVISRSPCGWHITIVKVAIGPKCPVCGGERGEPFHHRFHEDGDWYSCNMWRNPCGHIDKYKDVLEHPETIFITNTKWGE